MTPVRVNFPWRIWFLCFLTLACFCQWQENSNVTTRIGLALSIANRHELTIDQIAPYTIDKAEFEGHAFSDKAPGLSFLAVPIVAAVTRVLHLGDEPYSGIGIGTNYHRDYIELIAIVTLLINGTATATAAALFFRWCRLRGISVAAATFASLGYALATPIMWWSTIFIGHAPAAAALLIGFVTLSESLGSTLRPIRAVLGGLVLGLAFLIELQTGPVVAMIAVCCLVDAMVQRRPWPRIVPTFLLSSIGLIGPLLLVGWYNHAAFGSPLHLGYGDVQGFPGMQTGFFGVSLPNSRVAVALLLGRYRGLLLLSPLLFLVPFGLAVGIMNKHWRVASVTAAAVFIYYWLLNAGYYYWWGGDATGPRQLLPGLALLPIALALFWDGAPRWTHPIAVTLLVLSAVIAALLAAMTVTAGESVLRPISDIWLPMMEKGHFPRAFPSLLGIHGYAALLPMLLVWLVFGTPVLRTARRAA